MKEAEFDAYAERYEALHAASIAITGEGPEYFAEYKIRDIARSVARGAAPSGGAAEALRICDFGAGVGGSVPFVHRHLPGAQLTCLDVSKRSLEVAERRYPELARFVHFDGLHLPLPEGQFDIAFAACVFHHIDPQEHAVLLQELRRILRPGGTLFVFEHNPWNPLAVRAVRSCPFDENARLIPGRAMQRRLRAAGFAGCRIRYRVFFPHALRGLRPLEDALTWLPLGGQYCAVARR
jgi:SAM-dependent methyltransferase